MAVDHGLRGDGGRRIDSPAAPGGKSLVQSAAILAAGVAAVSFVAGVGTYLYIRLTQGRKRPPDGGGRGGNAT